MQICDGQEGNKFDSAVAVHYELQGGRCANARDPTTLYPCAFRKIEVSPIMLLAYSDLVFYTSPDLFDLDKVVAPDISHSTG